MKTFSLVRSIRLIMVSVFALTGIAAANAQSHYSLIKTIDLPGQGGHGDWVTYDEQTNTVWIGGSMPL